MPNGTKAEDQALPSGIMIILDFQLEPLVSVAKIKTIESSRTMCIA